MSDTATRLAQYKAAEAKILAGQRIRLGEREITLADLAIVQEGIRDLEAKLVAETAATRGRSGLSYSRANLTGFGRGARGGCDW